MIDLRYSGMMRDYQMVSGDTGVQTAVKAWTRREMRRKGDLNTSNRYYRNVDRPETWPGLQKRR